MGVCGWRGGGGGGGGGGYLAVYLALVMNVNK
jgi:hypothetical protein